MAALGLAIDTTFDDTSVAIVRGANTVLANLTISQFEDHKAFGGVVPERASRRHLEVIHPLIDRALAEAELSYRDLDWVAASNRPGLLGAILVGLSVAKSLSYALDIPLIGINHIEAHPYAGMIEHDDVTFPLINLVVAGGHTLLIHQRGHGDWTVVGRSVDDAAGECADKVARIFGLPMPGGKAIDDIAMVTAAGDYDFPRPLLNQDNLDFSFSGLKTAMKRFHDAHFSPEGNIAKEPVLAAFFESVCDVLVAKTLRAADRYGVGTITVSGGLAASRRLRRRFADAAAQTDLRLIHPRAALCTDNAAMVGCLASYYYAAGRRDTLDLRAVPNISD
ncbi:tRNA (adenosine(37)-N6)-threonylcarbamoyltransferase complex transferase subunit TsaD [Varunaivibrio sulfuroxidans]|uniref:tRNA N6-adenosine threonylcarbamoyltransferase n=1 Tax=Varunaivibrio sulfuroxidans TaxID=1773489 RepID=A0A4V2UNE2_9PROT|nr:tRNA (adenosine(37)-N6)-threonylcarbamoyltransferase complex transferase subunit TsaD [Varunaivibrio sulfuroxidans]TCS61781.1 O-sialoglycoprotein endopeptidase [Varunaivibrio sulfuroxidans]WES32036.1 tRNA (adenosine(37)-N6)-threonylcarbamoyltransferase complex transferase subunit TsaD [Varunaivibrio sulfuroxidans]